MNRNRILQPLFKVELNPEAHKLGKRKVHPIYNLRYLLHGRLTVEEQHKRNGPAQCMKCQEFGHTKSYCTLSSAYGEFHKTVLCAKTKTDATVIKCNNCGQNHIANYRGCEVYKALKQNTRPVQRWEQQQMNSVAKIQILTSSINLPAISKSRSRRIDFWSAI